MASSAGPDACDFGSAWLAIDTNGTNTQNNARTIAAENMTGLRLAIRAPWFVI
jgi:hypothetical protein